MIQTIVPRKATRFFPFISCLLMAASACSAAESGQTPALRSIPAAEKYCISAQRLVTQTGLPVNLQLQTDFDAFVRSKALIEGPTIQQFNWSDGNDELVGISCKLKNADHLLAVFGPGSAGPDGACQDMNRAVYALVAREIPAPVYPRVVFDPAEGNMNEGNPGMTGPDWLAPFTLTTVDADGSLRIHTKGFIVNFSDPRFEKMPVRFRGVHYCHFIAPAHLRALLEGRAKPGVEIGRRVETDPGAMR